MKPSFQLGVARKPADYARVGQWASPLDEYAQWSLGGSIISLTTQNKLSNFKFNASLKTCTTKFILLYSNS